MDLGEAIAFARGRKGLTLRELGHRSGVSNAQLSLIETGKIKEPRFTTIARIAKVLGLSLDRLARYR